MLAGVLFGRFESWGVAAEPVAADVLLSGGLIVDGSGQPGVIGDVAIQGDRIVAVGKFATQRIGRTIDCRGLVVTPGFIDLHTHSDAPILEPLTRAAGNYLLQGCTTQVTGNCGMGPVDAGVFYRKVEEHGCGTNIAHLLPQGDLREAVLGKVDRPATAEEIEAMRRLATQAMRDGCWGMSTGLIYVPSVYASTEELIAMAAVVASSGGLYASHIRGEGSELLTAVEEAIRIGAEAKLPVHISHFKASGIENWGTLRAAVARVESARERGALVTADQYPYTASSTSLEATIVPTWARAGGQAELIKRLDADETGPRLKTEIARSLARKRDGAALFIVRYRANKNWIGKHLQEIAASGNRPVADVAVEILRNGGASVVHFSMSEDDVRMAMPIPWVATASDGRAYLPGDDKPHPRSYGTFPRKIGHYALREKVISLEQAVRSATALPAEILGLQDRGRLQVGQAADVVVFDPQRFVDRATFDDPHRYPQGITLVMVNGQPAVHDGMLTGALAGRALRRPERTASSVDALGTAMTDRGSR